MNIPSGKIKNVIGLMKDEFGGKNNDRVSGIKTKNV